MIEAVLVTAKVSQRKSLVESEETGRVRARVRVSLLQAGWRW